MTTLHFYSLTFMHISPMQLMYLVDLGQMIS